jgi:hypothetical protein
MPERTMQTGERWAERQISMQVLTSRDKFLKQESNFSRKEKYIH